MSFIVPDPAYYLSSEHLRQPLPQIREAKARGTPGRSQSQSKPNVGQKDQPQCRRGTKIVASDSAAPNPQDNFLRSHHDNLKSNSSFFHITRGQFTNFIQKNNHYKPIGPLHGDERTQNRILQTKKSVWLKPSQDKSVTTFNSTMRNTNSYGSSMTMSKNSKLITQKQRIRLSRDSVNIEYQRSLEKRKAGKNMFLPKLGSQVQMNPLKPQRYVPLSCDQSEDAEDIRNLELFERSMSKRLH